MTTEQTEREALARIIRDHTFAQDAADAILAARHSAPPAAPQDGLREALESVRANLSGLDPLGASPRDIEQALDEIAADVEASLAASPAPSGEQDQAQDSQADQRRDACQETPFGLDHPLGAQDGPANSAPAHPEASGAPESGLISRKAVIDLCRRLASDHADMALCGDHDHARRRESMAAMASHIQYAVAFLPVVGSPQASGVCEGEDAQPYKDALGDLVFLKAQDDIGCVPPPTKEQWRKAWAEAEELVRVEP